jgi:hypothetical protein
MTPTQPATRRVDRRGMKSPINAAVAVASEAGAYEGRISISSRRVSLVAEGQPPAPSHVPIWEPLSPPPGMVPTSSEVLNASAPKHRLPPDIEERFIATLTRPLDPSETQQSGNNAREGELRGLIETLSAMDAYVLRKRLDADRNDDKLAVTFRRLIAERRARLKVLLADPRRGRR